MQIILALNLALSLQNPTHLLSAITPLQILEASGRQGTILSLSKTHRHKRSWKTLWLKPGKEYRFFYRCFDEQGGEFIKESNFKIPATDVPDERSFGERHPNLAVANAVAGFATAPLIGIFVGVKK